MDTPTPLVVCTHPVPPNNLGIVAMHCYGNQPMPLTDLKKIFDGPVTAIQDLITAELAKPLIVDVLP